MLLDMSALNQNNKSLSRLAIISKHVAADKRKRFGTVWVDFCQGEFSFSIPGSIFFSPWYLFILSERNPFLHSVCPFPSRTVYSNVVLTSWCFDANGGCSEGGAPGSLMSSKCRSIAERCLLPLTGDEVFAVEEIGGGLADRREGGCPSWLISRCVWERVGAQPQWFRK